MNKKNIKYLLVLFFYLNLVNVVQAEEHYFAEGKKLFNSKKYEDQQRARVLIGLNNPSFNFSTQKKNVYFVTATKV